MAFEKVIIPSEKELIIKQIEEKIVSGQLPIGSRLPTERELAEEMGVTKSVVHFALKDLEQLKFLICVPRHGTYINDWLKEGSFETLNAVLKLQGVHVDPGLKESLIHLRNIIEADAMELCSENCSQADFEELQAAIDRLTASPADAGAKVHAELVRDFHFLIMEKSGNLMYPILMKAFADFSTLIWENCVNFWGRDRVAAFEQNQLDLIRSGRAKEAGQQIKDMYAHFQVGEKY